MEGADIASGLMTNPLDLKEIFYSNILLLGFDSEGLEAQHRVPFNRDMFLYPNKKAMEIILYFLFCKLDAQLAFQEFRDCWPIKDKKQEAQFRKSCNSWLTKISKEEPDSNLPRIGPSLFLSPGGDRFYEVMFCFSSYVVRQVMARDHAHGKDKSIVPHVCKKMTRMPNMTKINSTAMLAKILSEKNRFLESVQCDLEVQEHWKSHAMASTKEYRKLCKENRELERQLNPVGHNFYLKEKTSYVAETEVLRRAKQLQEVRELWSKLESFHDSTKEKREILNEILENNEAKFHLEGSSIQLQVPDVLTTKYRHAIQMKNIQNTYEEGKLNILSLIQLSNLSSQELKEKIKQDGVPNFEQSAPTVKHDVRTHTTYLAQVQTLRTSLKNDVIPELKKSIDHLKEECYSFLDEMVHSPVLSLESFDFGLGLLPATPSPTFTTLEQVNAASRIPDISLRKTPRHEATPDVIENLTSSIRDLVVRGNEQPEYSSKGSHIRTIDGSEIPKPFVSKIPKPLNHRLSRTPDVSREKSTAVRRRSLTSSKKPSKMKALGDNGRTGKLDSSKKAASHGGMAASQRMLAVDQESNVVIVNDDHFKTPLAAGTKSVFKKPHSSARNILAEKIAAAVISDGPSGHSSKSSSEENTPKDLAIADPLVNLSEEPFISKDLIPRTPFKREDIFPESGVKSQLDDHDTSTTNELLTSPRTHSIIAHLESPTVLLTATTVATSVGEVFKESPSDDRSTDNRTTSLSSSVMSTSTGGNRVSRDLIAHYQRLKKAQEDVQSDVVLSHHQINSSPQFAEATLENGENRPGTTDAPHDEAFDPYLQSPLSVDSSTSARSVISSLSNHEETTSNPLLLRYQQLKKAQEVTVSSDTTIVTSLHLRSSDVTFSDTTEVTSHNGLHITQSDVTSLQSRLLNDHGGLLRYQELGTDDVIGDMIGQQGTPTVTFSRGFTTPVMSSKASLYFHEFGQTPLEHIAPPMDFNYNSLDYERRDCVRSKLSFDFATPGSSMRTASAQRLILKTPSACEIANIKVDDFIEAREPQLIPVKVDNLFEDDEDITGATELLSKSGYQV